MGSVFCAGELLIDFISGENGCSLDETKSFYKQSGGAPANAAAAVSNFGGYSYFAGAVGDDPFGYFLKSVLEKYRVNTDYLSLSKSSSTTLAFVSLMENGERDFVFIRGADSEYSITKEEMDKIDDLKIVHFGSATAMLGGRLEETYKEILRYASAERLFVSFDPNYRGAFWKGKEEEFVEKNMEFLKAADIVKLSDEELRIFTGLNDVEDGIWHLYKVHPATYCVTLGRHGTLVFNGRFNQIVKSIPVNPVDTTGAGDAFVGALLYKLSLLENPREILESDMFLSFAAFANITGALVTTEKGALTALPSIDDVERLISNI